VATEEAPLDDEVVVIIDDCIISACWGVLRQMHDEYCGPSWVLVKLLLVVEVIGGGGGGAGLLGSNLLGLGLEWCTFFWKELFDEFTLLLSEVVLVQVVVVGSWLTAGLNSSSSTRFSPNAIDFE